MGFKPRIVIAGAGAIGCFVGGLWANAGFQVTLLGRSGVLDAVAERGLHLTDYAGLDVKISPSRFILDTDPACLETASIVVVCVKSAATPDMAALIARHAPEAVPVLSFQNGLENAQTLRDALPDHDVRAAMVPFNVVPTGPGGWHRATSGDIVIAAGPGPLHKGLSVAHLTVKQSADITAVQWGKLLINLNNAPNALSGLTLQQQLLDRDWRRLMADQMAEALAVLRAHDIRVKPTTPVPAAMIPHILRLPTPLFRRIAASMLTIDADARTSMAHDLNAGRPTEIDALQGKIISLGATKKIPTPLCVAMAAMIREGDTGISPAQIRKRAQTAAR